MEILGWAALAALLLYVLTLSTVHPIGRWWVAYWHGRGARHQFAVYRCDGCRRLVTHRRIRDGGCGCGSIRLRPAVLSLTDKGRLLFLPWLVR